MDLQLQLLTEVVRTNGFLRLSVSLFATGHRLRSEVVMHLNRFNQYSSVFLPRFSCWICRHRSSSRFRACGCSHDGVCKRNASLPAEPMFVIELPVFEMVPFWHASVLGYGILTCTAIPPTGSTQYISSISTT
jgi:hypothetical protein